jgi:purine-nucleoside phosphorylase
MFNIPTPHIGAKSGEIAETVIMPGDPLRAKFIAESFLENSKCFNKIRNMLGFTGIYHGKRISVMGSGMGMPSIGIYSYELFNFYDVKKIIRIGTAGSISESLKVGDILAAMGICTDSNYAHQYNLSGTFSPIASFDLLSKAVEISKQKNKKLTVGNILCSDVFYDDESYIKSWSKMNVLAIEMESAALYMNAARAKKEALCLLTISNSFVTNESLSTEERETGLTDMTEMALSLF